MRKRTQVRAIRCDRCATRLADPSKRIFSRFSKSHYCADLDGCARRAKRTMKRSAA